MCEFATLGAKFLSTLSLRRATDYTRKGIGRLDISIHALLAESDAPAQRSNPKEFDFYPRSPCGERQWTARMILPQPYFYPRSPCGERPVQHSQIHKHNNFYPRSPCGERLSKNAAMGNPTLISIHALLAESDWERITTTSKNRYFYPRSPCGERPFSRSGPMMRQYFYPRSPCGERHWPASSR